MLNRYSYHSLIGIFLSASLLSACSSTHVPYLSTTGLEPGAVSENSGKLPAPQSDEIKVHEQAGTESSAANPGKKPSFAEVKSNPLKDKSISEFSLTDPKSSAELRFQSGDTLKVSIWGYPELDTIAVVQPNGKITLPLTGEIDAADATVGELRQRITDRLEPFTKVSTPDLRPGDGLTMEVWQHDDLSKLSVIEPAGMVTFPLIGRIQAAGRTLEDIRKEAQQKMLGYMRDVKVTLLPTYNNRRVLYDHHVSVLATKLQSRRVALIGEVNNQGMAEINGSLRLVEALAQAQLRQTTAELNSIIVIRDANGSLPQYRMIRLGDYFDGKAPDQNIYLQNSDIVIVPKTFIAKAGDFVEQFFTRTMPVFTWWSSLHSATVAKDSADTVKLINESLQKSLTTISVNPSP